MVAKDAHRGDVHYQPPASVIKSNINYAACSLQAQKLRGPALSLDASDWSKKQNNNSRKTKKHVLPSPPWRRRWDGLFPGDKGLLGTSPEPGPVGTERAGILLL